MNSHKHARLTYARRLELVEELIKGGVGTTQAALESFAADGLPRIVSRAVAAATRRGAELAAALDDAS